MPTRTNERRGLWRPRAGWMLLAVLALAAGHCGKGDGEKKKEAPNFFPPEPPMPKLDLSDVSFAEPEDASAGKPPADTWAGHVKDVVAQAAADMQRCRNEFLIPFQFASMKRRDVMFVNLNEMDEVCELGSKQKKTRGVLKWLESLAKEQVGRNAALDRFIVAGLEQVENYKAFSLMCKKIGAHDIDVVVGIAQKSQARILELAPTIDRLAADVAQIKDDQLPDDDPKQLALAVDVAALKGQIVANYAPFLADLGSGYERMADKSWQVYDMPKLETLRAMMAIIDKRAQQDRVRAGKATQDPKESAELTAFFAACDAATKQVAAGYDFYEKKPRDERPEHDPNLKAVKAAQKPVMKTLTAWGYAEPKK